MIDYKLYLIRHGITQGNLEGRYIGSTDLPLCPEGEAQLRQLLEARDYPQVKKVYTSPMQRCLDTAEILYPDQLIQTVPQLREYDFGVLDGKSVEEAASMPAFRQWSDSAMKAPPQGGERTEDFLARCEEGLALVVEDMMRHRITEAALILHGGVMMNLLATHAYPKREPVRWKTGPGEGFTALINPQLWHRGQILEIFDPIPYEREDLHEPSPYAFFDLEEDEEEP